MNLLRQALRLFAVFCLALLFVCCLAVHPALAQLPGQGPPEVVVFNLGDPISNLVTISNTANCLAPSGNYSGTASPPNYSYSLSGNTVTLNGGTVGGNVFGAFYLPNNGDSGVIKDNEVFINGGTVGGNVVGGYLYSINGDALVSGNKVWMTNATVSGTGVTAGGRVETASQTINNDVSALNNSLIISNSQISGSIWGGDARSESNNGTSTTTGNILEVSAGSQIGTSGNPRSAYGGNAAINNGIAIASDNKLIISASYVSYDILGGLATGGGTASIAASATASNNTVESIDGTLMRHIYGGSVRVYYGTATASDNSVTVSGGTVGGYIVGGYSQVTSGVGSAKASDNTVTVSDITLTNWVAGGVAYNSNSGSATATGNTTIISGGTVSDNVYGGLIVMNPAKPISGKATGNTVTIKDSPNLTAASLYGGGVVNTYYTPYTGSGLDVFTGNTLNLHSPVTVKSVQNFENWNFYLPATMGNGATMLTTGSGGASLGTGATVNVGIAGSSSVLKVGDTVKLIDASMGGLSGTLANTSAIGQGMQGVTILYEFTLVADTSTGLLTATVGNLPTPGPTPGQTPGSNPVSVNPQSKSLNEGFLGGPALANAGANFVAGKGMAWAVDATLQSSGQSSGQNNGQNSGPNDGPDGADNSGAGNSGNGFGAFGGIEGGSSRYQTGSHVDMKSVSLLAGLAWGADLTPGRLTLGGFLESGTGSYDTFNSFANLASVRGDGNTHNFGGGVLGRFDANSEGYAGLYTEGSFRVGRLHNEYRNNDLLFMGQRAEYNSDSTYFGFHFGGGYILNFSHKSSLDLYGKYFWTRVQGDSVRLSTGDPVKFDNVDSSRLRLGGRFAYTANEYVSPYLGAAYEHEFDGKARATTNGFAISAPSMRGGTGIGELGLTIKPSPSLPLSFDLGVQGYVGKRQGVTGNLQIRYEF